jgi:hypothetical protein
MTMVIFEAINNKKKVPKTNHCKCFNKLKHTLSFWGSKLSSYESKLQNIVSRIDFICSQFSSVSRNLDWYVKTASNINSRMAAIKRELSVQSQGISEMKTFLGNARIKHDAVENKNIKSKKDGLTAGGVSSGKIPNTNKTTASTWGHSSSGTNYNVGKAVDADTTSSTTSGKTSRYKPDWIEAIMKGVGKVGVVGSFASTVYNVKTAIASGKSPKVAKSIIGVAKDSLSRFGTLTKNAYDGKSVKETLFGDWTKGGAVNSLFKTTAEVTSATKGRIFKEALEKEFKRYSFKNASNIAGKIKVATKLACTALSAVTNYIDNVEESRENGNSKGRIFTETISETAIHVVLEAAATAGATALLGAVAPTVAVDAVAAGAIGALDTATKAITSHFWGEKNKKRSHRISFRWNIRWR